MIGMVVQFVYIFVAESFNLFSNISNVTVIMNNIILHITGSIKVPSQSFGLETLNYIYVWI